MDIPYLVKLERTHNCNVVNFQGCLPAGTVTTTTTTTTIKITASKPNTNNKNIDKRSKKKIKLFG